MPMYKLLEGTLEDMITFPRATVDPSDPQAQLRKPMSQRGFGQYTGNSVGWQFGDDAWWDSERDHLVVKLPHGRMRVAVARVKRFMVSSEVEPAEAPPVPVTAKAKAK